MNDELLTLEEISESTGTPTTLEYWKKQAPRVWELDIDDVQRARSLDSNQIMAFATNQDIWSGEKATIGEKIGRGISEIGSALRDVGGDIEVARLKYDSPSLTADESEDLLTAVFRNQRAIRAVRAQIQEQEGTAGSYWTLGANAIGQGILYAAAGLATGGMAVPVIAGVVQSGAATSQRFSESYAEKTGDDTLRGQPAEDDLLAVANGAISGWIESRLGVERFISRPLVSAGARRAAKQAIIGAAGEAAEEFSQEFVEYGIGKIADREDRTLEKAAGDAMTGAVFGALAGGTLGAGMYYANRESLANFYKKQGYSATEAKVMATEAIESAKFPVIREIVTRSQLENHFGKAYTELNGKIESALTSAGWLETHPEINISTYSQVVAGDIAGQVFQKAERWDMETKDILDLAEIEVIDNVVYLKPSKLGTTEDIDRQIQAKQNQVKELTRLAKTGAGDAKRKSELNTQIEVLQKLREKREGERFVQQRASRERKAKTDALTLRSVAPSVNNIIESIDVTAMKSSGTAKIKQEIGGGPFVYVSNMQLPVVYKVVEMSKVQASHIGDEINPNYSIKELQNRAARGTKADVSILQTRAANIQPENMGVAFNTQNGAPIVNERGDIIAGNGRYEILRMTNEQGRGRYNEFLKSLGFDPSKYQAPILVREMTGLTREQQIAIADASNVSSTSAFDHASQATQDAKLLSALGTNINMIDFMNQIPIESRQALFLTNGRIDMVALERRYNDALMMWLLGNDQTLFDELYLIGELGGKTISALNQVTGQIYELEQTYGSLGIRADIESALKKLPFIARRADFAMTIAQTSIEDGSANLFHDNALLYNFTFGSSKIISQFFMSYVDSAIQNATQSNEVDLFGNPLAAAMSKADIFGQTLMATYPEAFENGVATDRNMQAVFLTQAQSPKTSPLNQIDIIPALFADTETARILNEKTWTRQKNGRLSEGGEIKIQVSNPLVVSESFDTRDVEVARKQGFDAIVQITDNKIIQAVEINQPLGGTFSKETGNIYLQASEIDYAPAIEYFGLTKNINLAGYILPDGSMLDFSGARQGSDGRSRQLDHRDIVDAYIEVGNEDVGMDEFLASGAIRIDGALGSINAETMPTAAQWEVIRKIVDKNTDEISLEIGQYNTVLETTNFSKVQAAIRGAINKAPSKVAQFLQGRQANGLYDPELSVIVLGKNSNTGTLPHEFAHFWADTMFNMWRSGQYSENLEFIEQTMALFAMLGVGLNQPNLTVEQHEMFATMTEAVIFGLAPVPTGAELPITAYLNWVPSKYESIRNIGFRDARGRIINPILDQRAVDFFNAWYQNANLPRISAGPEKDMASNSTGTSDAPILSTPEVMAERQQKIDAHQSEQDAADQILNMQIKESLPTSTNAAIQGHVESIRNNQEEKINQDILIDSEKRPSWWAIGKQKKTDIQQIAERFVKKDPAKSLEIAKDDPLSPVIEFNGDREALILAVIEQQKIAKGSEDWELLHHNIAMTRKAAGKQLGMHNADSYGLYLDGLSRIAESMERNAAAKYCGADAKSIDKLNKDIMSFVRKYAYITEITDISDKTSEITGMLKAAAEQFGEEFLAQIDISNLSRSTSKEKFIAAAEKLIRQEIVKSEPNMSKIAELRKLSERAEIASKEINDKDANKAAAAALVIKEWNAFIDNQAKPTWMDNLFGQWAAQAMLSNPATSVVNLFGNTLEKGIINRALAAQYGKNNVAQTVLDAERSRLTKIYLTSGMSLPSMANTSSPSFIHGEKYRTKANPLAGKTTLLRSVANINPLQSLGFADFIFRRDAFIDTLGRMATLDAQGDSTKAEQLFDEYTQIRPQPAKGIMDTAYDRRAEALEVASIAVFQQDGTIANMINKMRASVNAAFAAVGIGTRKTGVGTLIAPFVKTPSNLVELGIRAIWSPFNMVAKPFTGKSITIEQRVDWKHFQYMAIGVAAFESIIAALGAVVDYEPPYVVGESYDPKKGYDSIIIGGKDGVALNINTFGPLAIPLRTYFSIRTASRGAIQGAIGDIPFIETDVSGFVESMSDSKKATRYIADWGYTQTNKLVPTLVRNIIRIGNKEMGNRADLAGIDLGLPKTGIGSKIERQYGLGEETDTANDYIGLFFNRLKLLP